VNIKKSLPSHAEQHFLLGNFINCGFNDANAIHTFDTHLLTVGWEILKVKIMLKNLEIRKVFIQLILK
jgi:hypothetical protein